MRLRIDSIICSYHVGSALLLLQGKLTTYACLLSASSVVHLVGCATFSKHF